MKLNLKLAKKFISILSVFSILLNTFYAPLIVLAQEDLFTPTPILTPTPTALSEPTASVDPIPTEMATATPEVIIETSPVSTPSSEPTQEPQPEVQGATNENSETLAPPSETSIPTPEAIVIVSESEGIITTQIVENQNPFRVTVQNNSWFSLTTDKLDYAPTETAIITGTDFTPNKTYEITVSSSDDPATSKTQNITTDSNGGFVFYYQLDGIYRPNYSVEIKNAGQVVAMVTFTDSDHASVGTLPDLLTALANSSISTINIIANISAIPSTLVVPVGHAVIINGGGFTLAFTGLESFGSVDDGFTIQAPTTINNLIVDAGLATPTTRVGTYAIQVYHTTATLNNVTAKNGNGGILSNNSTVTLTGAINVSSNGFGGIESSGADASLNVAGVSWTNSSEAYGLPTVWEDGLTGDTVINYGAFTRITKGGQYQYYLTASNASNPVTWPTTWTTPNSCVSDPVNDESPSSTDLIGSSATSAVGFASDANYQYFRERVDGNPSGPGIFNQFAWVVLFQTSGSQYQYLGSVDGNGEKVRLYQNTTPAGAVDFNPLLNDPAETVLWEGDTSVYSRITTGGDGKKYVEWAIPLTELTSRGITLSTTKFFATSANANNFNKDHLKCYEAFADLSVVKTDSPDPVISGGTLTYTLAIHNAGPDSTSGVVVTDTLPAGFSVTSVTPSQGSCSDITTPSIQCELGTLANGANASISIVGTMVGAGTVTNSASVNLDTTVSIDLNLTNNSDTEDTTITQPTGTINIVKVGNGVNTQDFGFDTTGGLSPNELLSSPDFYLDDDTNATLSNTKTFTGVTAGTYTVSEVATAGWTLGSIVCTDPTTNSTVSNPTATINLAAGETVTCTFTNTLNTGSIKVNKMVDSNGDRDYLDAGEGVNGTASTPFTWTYRVIGPNTMGTTQSGLTSGSGSLSENVVANYHLVGWYRNSGSGSCAAPDSTTLPASIDIPINNTVEITICNAVDTGTIKITKNLTTPNDPGLFNLLIDSTTYATNVGNLGTTGVISVPVGQHTMSETAGTNTSMNNYNSSISCFLNSVGIGSPANGIVTVSAGQNYDCFISNGRKQSLVTVNKQFDSNGDGSFEGDNTTSNTLGFRWTLNGGANQTMGTFLQFPFTQGSTVSINENIATGYHFVGWYDPNAQGGFSCNNVQGNTLPITYTEVGPLGSNKTFTLCNQINTGSISGYKYDTTSGLGLLGWIISLLNTNSNVSISTATSADGSYSFFNLWPNTYVLSELLVSGWTQTSSPTNPITLSAGQVITGQNFVNFQNVSISGQKFNDLNSNGVKNAGEPGLANWTINLDRDANGSVDATATTDVSGDYSFTNIGPGIYRLREVNQIGWTQTSANPSDVVTASGQNVSGIDFGNRGNLSITACKYEDSNGIQNDGNFTPVSNWDFTLGQTTQNTGDGNCTTFENLIPGAYDVSELPVYDGWYIADDSQGSRRVVLTNKDELVNFYNYRKGEISGTKWNDVNSNGDWEYWNDEPTLSNWHIELFENNSGVKGAQVGVDQITNSHGNYSFAGVNPGDYFICEVLQDGWTQTYPDFDQNYPNCHEVTVTSGQEYGGNDFGNFKLGQIYGYKYEDTNGDGYWDDGEYGINGWEICLYNEDSEDEECTYTDDDGYFEFTGLEYGYYELTEDETNPDYQRTQPETSSTEILIESGDGFGEGDAYYFGNAPLTNIYGAKWDDVNGNGERDEDEDLLGGWTIFLDENDNETLDDDEQWATTYENQNNNNFGLYFFRALMPGDYTICEVQQDGWNQTYPFGYLYDEETDDEYPTFCHNITLPNDNEEYNFGNEPLASSVEISKSNDKNNASVGDIVNYTLVITNTGKQTIYNLDIKDSLPGGFSYVLGTTTGDTTTDPIIAGGNLTWANVINLLSEESITIHYQVKIVDNASNGTYKNFATCVGINGREETTECNIADSIVTLGSSNSYGGSLFGQVLGASIELPATGSPTWLLAFALLGLTGGLYLKKKYAKN